VVVPPITTCPDVNVSDVNAEVVVVPDITTPFILNEVLAVPPPAIRAVPKIGWAAAP
jgi:hypothetical protein